MVTVTGRGTAQRLMFNGVIVLFGLRGIFAKNKKYLCIMHLLNGKYVETVVDFNPSNLGTTWYWVFC